MIRTKKIYSNILFWRNYETGSVNRKKGREGRGGGEGAGEEGAGGGSNNGRERRRVFEQEVEELGMPLKAPPSNNIASTCLHLPPLASKMTPFQLISNTILRGPGKGVLLCAPTNKTKKINTYTLISHFHCDTRRLW